MECDRVMAIPRARYQRLLYEAAVEEGVEVRLSSRIESIDESASAVMMVNGEKVQGHLVIGADGESLSSRSYNGLILMNLIWIGIKSTVRTAVLGGNDVQPIPESIAYQYDISGDAMRSSHLTAPLMEGGAIHSTWGLHFRVPHLSHL